MRKRKGMSYPLIAVACLAFLFFSCSMDPGRAFLEVDPERCSGCARCALVCPVDAVRIIGQKAVIDPGKCTACGNCVEACPENAVQ